MSENNNTLRKIDEQGDGDTGSASCPRNSREGEMINEQIDNQISGTDKFNHRLNDKSQDSSKYCDDIVVLKLDRKKFFKYMGLFIVLLAYTFIEGLLPVMLTGKITAISVKPYYQLSFFVVSILSFIFIPMAVFPAIWRNGSLYLYSDKVVFHRSIGGTRCFYYSSMLVLQKHAFLKILNHVYLRDANWIKLFLIEGFQGIVVPLTLFLENKEDAQKAIDILKKRAKEFKDMNDIRY